MENIIIVGAGPAGISAALYAARGNMDPLIINTGIGSLEKQRRSRIITDLRDLFPEKNFLKEDLSRPGHLASGFWMHRLWEWEALIPLR